MHTQFEREEEPTPMAEINATPLIDVLLVLLVVLILTLPALTHRTNLDIGSGGPGVAREFVTITVDFDGSLYLSGNPIRDLDDLAKIFQSIAGKANQPDVRTEANRSARYDTVAKVLALAQKNGVRYLGFVGQERFAD